MAYRQIGVATTMVSWIFCTLAFAQRVEAQSPPVARRGFLTAYKSGDAKPSIELLFYSIYQVLYYCPGESLGPLRSGKMQFGPHNSNGSWRGVLHLAGTAPCAGTLEMGSDTTNHEVSSFARLNGAPLSLRQTCGFSQLPPNVPKPGVFGTVWGNGIDLVGSAFLFVRTGAGDTVAYFEGGFLDLIEIEPAHVSGHSFEFTLKRSLGELSPAPGQLTGQFDTKQLMFSSPGAWHSFRLPLSNIFSDPDTKCHAPIPGPIQKHR